MQPFVCSTYPICICMYIKANSFVLQNVNVAQSSRTAFISPSLVLCSRNKRRILNNITLLCNFLDTGLVTISNPVAMLRLLLVYFHFVNLHLKQCKQNLLLLSRKPTENNASLSIKRCTYTTLHFNSVVQFSQILKTVKIIKLCFFLIKLLLQIFMFNIQ